jgi:hypothetical protein
MAEGNRFCNYYKTIEPVVARNREFTTDMAVNLPTMSVGIPLPLKASPETTSQRYIENKVKNYGDVVAAPECETGGWTSLLFWNVNTLMVFVILPISLGVAVFVSLMAVNYILKRGKDHRTQHDTQGNENHVAAFFSSVPVLKTQLTTELVKSQAGYENRSSDGYRGAEYHVYERID